MKKIKNKITTILVVLLVVQSGFLGINTPLANSDDSAVHLSKNQTAPFDGYEITPAQAIKIHDLSIDNDSLTHINQDLAQEVQISNQRLTNAQTQNESLSKQLVETKESGFFSKVGFFVLGAVVTGLVSYGVYKTK